MARTTHRSPRVLVVGAGAAGSLTALHLVREAARRSVPLDVVLVDPAARWARGVAFGTDDERHLLNVPAAGMSALPEDPSHFVAWRRRQGPTAEGDSYCFAPRQEFSRYLDETLSAALRDASGVVGLEHRRRRAVGVTVGESTVALTTEDGEELSGDALVVATGLPASGHDWAPPALRGSAFFIADPWAPGALDVVRRDRVGPPDVLVVGAGLTMVDVTLSLVDGGRPDRVVRAISRTGRLPSVHAPTMKPVAIPDIEDWGDDLDAIRERVRQHVAAVERATGDWRPAVDGLRYRVAELWGRLDEDDRAEFLRRDAAGWNVVRHRMAPTSRATIEELWRGRRLDVRSGTVRDVEPLTGGGLRVRLADGTSREVGWVVNCTGPRLDVRTLGNPLIDDLFRAREGGALAVASTAGMGVRTVDGRLVDQRGASEAPIWTLGALRRGELWESTAVPEIRAQARALAVDVLDAIAPLPRRLEDGTLVDGRHPIARPRDPLGLPLSTTADAAAAYNAGLERVMRLQAGGEDLIRQATELDPDFALAHAALAMLGHEAGAAVDVRAALVAARRAARRRGDARERSFVDMVGRRVRDARHSGAQALLEHIEQYPRDVLAVSAAVPTIAFSGTVDVQQDVWDLVERLAPSYGDHWWYISILAFVRQDQGRYDEAALLAESALSCEPASGHAAHALSHVFYETGQHVTGREWLDHWVAESGRSASHRAHFSWHAALHELALDDTEAVRTRYYTQLAPPAVTGVRALVDSASLLWRWRAVTAAEDRDDLPPPPVEPVLGAIGDDLLERPASPFTALHAAIGLAAAGDARRLTALAAWCRKSAEAPTREIVAPVCDALVDVTEARWTQAADRLEDVLPDLVRVGGSQAQREVIALTREMCLRRAAAAPPATEPLDAGVERVPHWRS